jgi:serine/threonine protein kinase
VPALVGVVRDDCLDGATIVQVPFVMMEKNVLTMANHPNIVKLVFSFQDATRLYIGMELCSGGELFRAIR